MKKLSIILPDNAVYVDGEGYKVDSIAGTVEGVQTLQWRETSGWIEQPTNPDGTQPVNIPIDVLPEWVAPVLAKWEEAKTQAIVHQAAFEAQEAERASKYPIEGQINANNP